MMYLGVKVHDVFNLLSNCSEKKRKNNKANGAKFIGIFL